MLIGARNILFSSRRPYKYEVEYLESTGTQWIDTGYIPTPATEAEAKVMPTDQTTSRFVFGCRQAQNNNTYACLLHSSSRIGYRVGTGGFVYVSGYSEVDAIHKYGIANGVFYRDGVVVSNACIGASFSTSSTLALLAINTNGTYDQKFIGRLYSCNIKNNSELVRDFIPVIDWNDRPAMYDKVTNKLFYNAGTGEFVVGPAVEAKGYIQDNLIAMWDAKENVGWNKYNATSTTWNDLIGTYNAIQRVPNAGWSWDTDAYVGTAHNGHGFAVPISLGAVLRNNISNHTIQLIFKPADSSRSTIFGQYNGKQGGLNDEYSPHLTGYWRVYYDGQPDVNAPAWKDTGNIRLQCTQTYDGSILKLYVDNTLSNSRKQNIFASRITDNQFIIGGEPGRTNMSIVGELCAIRIYSKVLTEDEMNTNYAIDKVRFNLPNI